MGADVIQEVISASNKEEAVQKYEDNPPLGYYDGVSYFIREVRFMEDVFETAESAFTYLQTRVKKWDKFAVMCQCGTGRFAYMVILPC